MKKTKKLYIIFEELKNAIMEGEYKPREPLNERDLATLFGASRSPIREAIRKLESIGMVKLMPNRSARVADYSTEEIEALYLVRNHLEQLAAKLAADSTSPQDIRNLTDINDKLINATVNYDYAKVVEENYRFHSTIASLSYNPFLTKMIEEIRSRSFPVSHYYWRNRERARSSIAEHKEMIKALKNHDHKQLITLTEKHLNQSKNVYLKYLAESKKMRSY